MKNLFEELSYKFNSKWTSFTYLFRRPYYRFRLFKRFMKTDYWGAWELVEPMLEYPFEMLCEFIEHGGIDHIDYESDDGHKHAKAEMDYLYKWYTEYKKERENEIEVVSDTWMEHHVSFWNCEGQFYVYGSQHSKYESYLFKLMQELEENLEKEKEENLIRLMKIRGYLWT